MSQRKYNPIEANGTQETKMSVINCILESPLDCWPLTLFFGNKIEPEKALVKRKKLTVVKKTSICLIFLFVLYPDNSQAQAYPPNHPNWGHVITPTSPDYRRPAPRLNRLRRGYIFIPRIYIPNSYRGLTIRQQNRLNVYKERARVRRELRLNRLKKLKEWGK